MGDDTGTAATEPFRAVLWPPVATSELLGELLGRLAHYLGTADGLVLNAAVTREDVALPARPAEVDGHPVEVASWDALVARTRLVTGERPVREPHLVLLHDAEGERYPGRVLVGTCVVDPGSDDVDAELARASGLARDPDGLVARFAPNREALLGAAATVTEVQVLAGAVDAPVPGVVVADARLVVGRDVPAGLRAAVVTDPRWVGPSTAAATARRALASVLAASRAHLVCTTRDAGLLISLEPALAEHLVVVPVGSVRDFPTVDLRVRFVASAPIDDLTSLLLPLASTLAPRVVVHGIDTAPDAGDADPDVRSALVARMVRAMEEQSVAVASATGTRIPALRRRQLPPVDDRAPHPADLVVMSPNFDTDFGHHGIYAHATATVARARGLRAVVLASRALEGDPEAVRYFTAPTLPLRAYPVHAATWRREFAVALAERVAPGGTAFMDCAGFQHVDAAADVAGEFPDRRLVLNLMDGHESVADAFGPDMESAAVRATLRAVLAKAADVGLVVSVDTDVLASDVREATGWDLPVLPMSTAFGLDPQASTATPDPDAPPLVLFAGKLRGGKGLDLVEPIALGLLEGPGHLRVALRPDVPPGGGSRRIELLLDRLRAAGAELLDSRVDEDAFLAQIRAATVVVLPYAPREFRTRTSGLVVDSLLAGTPVVTSAGTWGATLSEREGGFSAAYDDATDFVRAVRDTVAARDRLQAALREAGPRLREEFSLERRVDFLLEAPRPSSAGPAPVDHGTVLSAIHGQSAARAGVGPGVRIAALERDLADRDAEIARLGRKVDEQAGELGRADQRVEKVTEARDRLRDERDVLRSELRDAKEALATRKPAWRRAASWLAQLFEGGSGA